MELIDEYKTLSSPAEGFFKDRGSKFYAYLFPMSDSAELSSLLETVKEQHPKARHHCFAYQLGVEGEDFRTNDDGEPSGSAGKPILNALKSAELTNCLAVIVRYFGGTLLGVSGLINAYRTATELGIAEAKIITETIDQVCELRFGFEDMGAVMNLVKKHDLEVLSQDYTDENILIFKRRLSDISMIKEAFGEHYRVGFVAL